MDKFDRIQRLHRMFRSHRNPVPLKLLASRLECSEKTVKRSMDTMREQLGAPIEFFAEKNGWHYNDTESSLYELPGLWLTAIELQSLALLIHLTNEIGRGMLGEELGVVERQIDKLLIARGIDRSAFDSHIKVIPLTSRYMANQIFAKICQAVLAKKRLRIKYLDDSKSTTHRVVSPQTLVYYRENWYLDAWCHLRKDIRTFSLPRITHSIIEKTDSKTIDPKLLHQHMSKGYGIFSGDAKNVARLRFSSHISREISLQQWHSAQTSKWEGDEYLLELPYSNDKELVHDILRHTPYVTVESPKQLRNTVKAKLLQGLELHRD